MKITPNITFKSTLKDLTVEQRNAAFAELTDEDKRLEIAWDALQLCMSGKVRPTGSEVAGEYIPSAYWGEALDNIKDLSKNSKDFQLNLLNATTCDVCERGLIMLSQIRIGNELSPDSSGVSCGESYNLKGFSIESMLRMEYAYEHNVYEHPYEHNTLKKMMNILCNVLINGDFNTDDKTDYLI